ncbi:hypothetical protein AAH979_13540 [Plantactinospora sp. ZYX-F-223]|uniref:hypothetical protein n=1 Tax=Plantactinospora sp. ZYX-F-223 TaxID=3144103 RepID=UPI0031FD3D75
MAGKRRGDADSAEPPLYGLDDLAGGHPPEGVPGHLPAGAGNARDQEVLATELVAVPRGHTDELCRGVVAHLGTGPENGLREEMLCHLQGPAGRHLPGPFRDQRRQASGNPRHHRGATADGEQGDEQRRAGADLDPDADLRLDDRPAVLAGALGQFPQDL